VIRLNIARDKQLGGSVVVPVTGFCCGTAARSVSSFLICEPGGDAGVAAFGITRAPNPWQDSYFEDVPVEIAAVPNFGYRLVAWEGQDDVRLWRVARLR
jgi:hypothetical protein